MKLIKILDLLLCISYDHGTTKVGIGPNGLVWLLFDQSNKSVSANTWPSLLGTPFSVTSPLIC